MKQISIPVITLVLVFILGCATVQSRRGDAKSNELHKKKVWENVKKEDSISSYEEFLRKYPLGEFADEARSRVETLYLQMAELKTIAAHRDVRLSIRITSRKHVEEAQKIEKYIERVVKEILEEAGIKVVGDKTKGPYVTLEVDVRDFSRFAVSASPRPKFLYDAFGTIGAIMAAPITGGTSLTSIIEKKKEKEEFLINPIFFVAGVISVKAPERNIMTNTASFFDGISPEEDDIPDWNSITLFPRVIKTVAYLYGAKVVIPFLRHKHFHVQLATAAALNEMGWQPVTDQDKVLSFIAGEDWNKLAEFIATGRIKGIGAVDLLIWLLEDQEVRKAAADALEKITGEKLGENQSEWQEWWVENKANYEIYEIKLEYPQR